MEQTVNRWEQRHLSDLLRTGAGRGAEVCFADPAAIAEAVAAGSDPQLYQATRNALPSRVTAAHTGDPLGPHAMATLWSADLVVYQHGTLPGGEPYRSIGHWNPVDQLEVFQVLSGRVLMLTCVIGEPNEQSYLSYQECRAGDVAVVPFGAWHLTHVLDGPAMVFNIYSGSADANGQTARNSPTHTFDAKYSSQRGPAEVTVTRSAAGFTLELSDKWREVCGEPTPATCPTWFDAYLPATGMLTDLHASASDEDLEALLAAARKSAETNPSEIGNLCQ